MALSILQVTPESVDEIFSLLEALGLIKLCQNADRYELVYRVAREVAQTLCATNLEFTQCVESPIIQKSLRS